MTFVGKVMSLLFNMLPRLVITLLPRSKRLLISWLQSPSAVILEPQKNKSLSLFPLFPHLFATRWWDGKPWTTNGVQCGCAMQQIFSSVFLKSIALSYNVFTTQLSFDIFSKYKNDSEIPKFFWDPHHLLYYGFRGRGVNKTDPH